MEKLKVLLIHSLSSPLTSIQRVLEKRGFEIHLSRSWEEAEVAYSVLPLDQIKYIFIDVNLCAGYGWEKFVHRAKIGGSDAILVTFHPKFPERLCHLMDQYPESPEPQAGNGKFEVPVMVGETAKFREALSLAGRYAQHDITLLVTGETGTGKEIIARYIHAQSLRKSRPLISCNLSAVPETLMESELFGYVKGAFTGAEKNKKGLIDEAQGGTLFLDEIGDLPLNIQPKLLRFLENREFYKVGESSSRTADVRIIAATNKSLEREIQNNNFRQDLYYRLNGATIILPPLRDRREDIVFLVEDFVAQACKRSQKPAMRISSSVKALFLDYPWPGNIRELRNIVESAVLVSEGEYLTVADLPMSLQQYASGHRAEIGSQAIRNLEDAQRNVIQEALLRANGNKSDAARSLGISTRTLYRRLERFAFAN